MKRITLYNFNDFLKIGTKTGNYENYTVQLIDFLKMTENKLSIQYL